MVTPKEAFVSAEIAKEKGQGVALLERPENADTAVDLEVEKQKAREEFEVLYQKIQDLSDEINAKMTQFAEFESEAKELALKGGGEYVPNNILDEVMEEGLEDSSLETKAKIAEQKPAHVPQTHLPSELGQVIIDATRTEDAVSDKAFNNTVPDERTHRRASLASANPVEAVAEPSVEEANTPADVFKGPEQPETSSVDEPTEKEEVPEPQEFASFEDYIAHMEDKHPSEGGIIPNGDNFQDAKTGKFVSTQAYADYANARKNESIHYYDKQNGIDNEGKVVEARNYTGMTIPELAREAGKVKYTNPGDDEHIDPELAAIREIAKAKYLEMAQESGDEKALANYAENMEDFEALAGRFEDKIREKDVVEREPKGVREKVKAWWRKHKENYGGLAWAAAWVGTKYNGYLDKGVEPEMEDDEANEIRKKNRKKIILGGIGLGLAAGVVGGAAGLAIHEALTPDVAPVPMGGGGGGGAGHFAESVPYHSGHAGAYGGEAALAVPTPELPSISDAAFNVPYGGTGEQLFKSLNMNPLDFYKHQEELIKLSSNDFYRMNDGSVGISHPGWLSENARTYLNSLRS
jgi:cytochrome c556